jgi:hypothetical protein
MALSLWAEQGLSGSLGARLDGITRRDIIGGGDDHFRRPGYTLFLDPGLLLRRGPAEFTVNFPIRVHQNFPQSIIDEKTGFAAGGDLADNLIYTGFTYRF